MIGHFKKANTAPMKKIVEFRNFEEEYKFRISKIINFLPFAKFLKFIDLKSFHSVCRITRSEFWTASLIDVLLVTFFSFENSFL